MMQDEKIALRALEPEDLEYLYRWENDMDMWDVSDTLSPFSHYALKKYIENAGEDIYNVRQVRFMIDTIEEKTPVGMVDVFDFDPYHQRAGIGIMIHNQENRRCGYATSAVKLVLDYGFEVLGLHEMHCCVGAENIASQRLFERLGFGKVGCRREWMKRGDDWEDVIFYQLLADDWHKQ